MLCLRARHSGSVGRALDYLVLGSLLAVTVLCPRARHSGSVGRALDWLVLGSLLTESLCCVLEQDTVAQLVEHMTGLF